MENQYAINLLERSIKESWDLMITLLKECNKQSYIPFLGKPPKVNFIHMRSKSVAGYYFYPKIEHPKDISTIVEWDDRIELNSQYLKCNDPENFIWEVSKHELAHCLNFRLNNRYHHDRAFRAISRAIGGNPKTYHDFYFLID